MRMHRLCLAVTPNSCLIFAAPYQPSPNCDTSKAITIADRDLRGAKARAGICRRINYLAESKGVAVGCQGGSRLSRIGPGSRWAGDQGSARFNRGADLPVGSSLETVSPRRCVGCAVGLAAPEGRGVACRPPEEPRQAAYATGGHRVVGVGWIGCWKRCVLRVTYGRGGSPVLHKATADGRANAFLERRWGGAGAGPRFSSCTSGGG